MLVDIVLGYRPCLGDIYGCGRTVWHSSLAQFLHYRRPIGELDTGCLDEKMEKVTSDIQSSTLFCTNARSLFKISSRSSCGIVAIVCDM